MSLVFATDVHKGATRGQSTIQKLLDENSQLIQTITEYQNSGRIQDAVAYQQLLHRNLMYLSSIADSKYTDQKLLGELQTAGPTSLPPQQTPPVTSVNVTHSSNALNGDSQMVEQAASGPSMLQQQLMATSTISSTIPSYSVESGVVQQNQAVFANAGAYPYYPARSAQNEPHRMFPPAAPTGANAYSNQQPQYPNVQQMSFEPNQQVHASPPQHGYQYPSISQQPPQQQQQR